MDITTVFGTVILGSNPGESTVFHTTFIANTASLCIMTLYSAERLRGSPAKAGFPITGENRAISPLFPPIWVDRLYTSFAAIALH